MSEMWAWLLIALVGACATGWQAWNNNYDDFGLMMGLCIGCLLCAAYWILRLTGVVQ